MSKEKDLDTLTRGDLEQLLQDQTDRLVGTVEDFRNQTNVRFDNIDEELGEIRTDIKNLKASTHDDITALFTEVQNIKEFVGMPVRDQA